MASSNCGSVAGDGGTGRTSGFPAAGEDTLGHVVVNVLACHLSRVAKSANETRLRVTPIIHRREMQMNFKTWSDTLRY